MFQQVVTSSLPPQPKDHSQCPSQKRTHEKTNRQFPKYQKMKGVLWALVSWGGVRCFFSIYSVYTGRFLQFKHWENC